MADLNKITPDRLKLLPIFVDKVTGDEFYCSCAIGVEGGCQRHEKMNGTDKRMKYIGLLRRYPVQNDPPVSPLGKGGAKGMKR